MMDETFEYDVFLSHNSQDKPLVRALATRLREHGLRVWLDEWVIKPGDEITSQVDHGKSVSRKLILCMSSAALNSDWVSSELNTTLFRDPMNRERRFIPLLLEDCVIPDTLRRFKYIDYRNNNEAGFQELVNICHPNNSENFDPELIIEDGDTNLVAEVFGKNAMEKTKTDVLQALYQAHRKAPGEWVNSEKIRKKLELESDQMHDFILALYTKKLIETNYLDERALLKITPDGVAILKDI